jgi:vacuolar-type H+-ATPase subunit I/STV1
MATENLQDGSTNQNADASNGEVTSLEQALEKIKHLEGINKDVISARDKAKLKLRELEEASGKSSEIQKQYDDLFAEKSKLISQYESTQSELNSLKESIKQEKVNSALSTALEAAGAKSASTVMKLIDKSKLQFDEQGNVSSDAIIAAIKEVQDSDPILFGEADPKKASATGQEFLDPGVKRASEANTDGAYEKEIRAAKNQNEIYAVMRKHGKIK